MPESDSLDVAVLVGSLRRGSYTRMVADAIIRLAPESLRFRFMDIRDLPLYNPDLEEGQLPPQWDRFRSSLRSADAFLFATAEYNRSIPGCLKNAIDIGSRPYGHSVWEGKPAAIVSVSPGAMGGFGANHHLRQCMVFLN